MRRAMSVLAFLAVTGCGDISPPTPEEQAAARAALPDQFSPVATSRRADGRALSLRWMADGFDLGEEEWRWHEVEVVAETGADASKAVSFRRTVTLDPRLLSNDVPAAFVQESWALTLRCEAEPCIRVETEQSLLSGAEQSSEMLPNEVMSSHNLLFPDYPERDRAIALVRRAIGAPPR